MKVVFLGKRIDKNLKEEIKSAGDLALECLNQEHKCLEVNVNFVDEKEIQRLNKEFRGVDKVTDVLSFPAFSLKAGEKVDTLDKSLYEGKSILLGDMAICIEQTKRQASEYLTGFDQEVIKLFIHSILHLMGYDHIKDSDFKKMNQKEEEIASKFYAK